MMKLFKYFSIVIAFYLSTGAVSFAQLSVEKGQSSLGVSPAIVEEILTPGKTSSIKIRVVNVTGLPLPIKSSKRNFMFNPDTYLSDEDIEASKGIFDVSSWMEVEPSDFILQPNETKDVIIHVNTPTTAQPGGHYATVLFQPLIPQDFSASSRTYLSAQVGVLNFFVVRGDIVEKANIAEIKTNKRFTQFGPVDISLIVRNEGNVHLMPITKIRVRNMSGNVVYELEGDQKIILPHTSQSLNAKIKDRMLFGRYTIEADLIYGSENTASSYSKQHSFYVIPWFVLLLLTLFNIIPILIGGRILKALKVLFKKEVKRDNV
jgi:hypothetical protein